MLSACLMTAVKHVNMGVWPQGSINKHSRETWALIALQDGRARRRLMFTCSTCADTCRLYLRAPTEKHACKRAKKAAFISVSAPVLLNRDFYRMVLCVALHCVSCVVFHSVMFFLWVFVWAELCLNGQDFSCKSITKKLLCDVHPMSQQE